MSEADKGRMLRAISGSISGHISGPGDFQEAFNVSDGTLAKLVTYEGLLRQWQQKINLVAPSTLDQIWHRHFADSAQLLELAPKGAKTWVDLGSGAGFPGLVLAIMRDGRGEPGDEVPLRLIESDQRKAAFLREVARKCSVAVDIAVQRIEISSTQANFVPVNVITARALAPLHRLLGFASAFFQPGTVALLPKGRDVESEIEAAREAWTFDVRLEPSSTDPEGRIAVVTSLNANT